MSSISDTPPIGVMPSEIYWQKFGVNVSSMQNRILNLTSAIDAYAVYGDFKPIPIWITELQQLLAIGRLV